MYWVSVNRFSWLKSVMQCQTLFVHTSEVKAFLKGEIIQWWSGKASALMLMRETVICVTGLPKRLAERISIDRLKPPGRCVTFARNWMPTSNVNVNWAAVIQNLQAKRTLGALSALQLSFFLWIIGRTILWRTCRPFFPVSLNKPKRSWCWWLCNSTLTCHLCVFSRSQPVVRVCSITLCWLGILQHDAILRGSY